jgi:HSP20 family protein
MSTKYFPVGLPAELRVFEDTLNRMFSEPATARPWTPPVDILEKENELVIKADLPDLELKDIAIEIENGTLTIKGERKFEPGVAGNGKEGYHRIERSYGAFTRYFSLPDTVDTEKVKAEYRNGVLIVTLAKKEVAKPRTIKIETSNN